MKSLITDNRSGCIALGDVPLLDYSEFRREVCAMLDEGSFHIAHYFAAERDNRFILYCILADDSTGKVHILSHAYDYYSEQELESITAAHHAMHPFEREIAELHGIRFRDNPWNKPLRFPAHRADKHSSMDNYPFYSIDGESLHEVNVGPIHAGIIEPGAFRFICNGEEVLHLEIALGYQHRGIEHLICGTDNRLRQVALAESIAGDSAVAHASAYAMTMEKLCGHTENEGLWLERTIALELERLAMHIADTGALCMDIGYQLGQVACEALRTIVINTTQLWCGNRFGKGLIRPGGTHYPLSRDLAMVIDENIGEVERRYDEVREDLKNTPSLLARFEECGTVHPAQVRDIGAVGLAARASRLGRDIRSTHPWGVYGGRVTHIPVIKEQGDVMARLMMRTSEGRQSAEYIRSMAESAGQAELPRPSLDATAAPGSLAFALIEGWRGEVCHAAVTDGKGRIATYKVKDPSMHNWMALALAVRGEGISDFPICNKSFNLSYCGHDL